jgi:GH15 family glucan-1,4-alpha-glucosidase
VVRRRRAAVERAIAAAQGPPAPGDLLHTRYTLDAVEGADDWPNVQLDGFGYADDSYYGGAAWVLLTAYLGWYYAKIGETARARTLLDWVAAQADDTGNLPEQITARLNHPAMLSAWERRWGRSAHPLLWSHAAYLTLAAHLGQG